MAQVYTLLNMILGATECCITPAVDGHRIGNADARDPFERACFFAELQLTKITISYRLTLVLTRKKDIYEALVKRGMVFSDRAPFYTEDEFTNVNRKGM